MTGVDRLVRDHGREIKVAHTHAEVEGPPDGIRDGCRVDEMVGHSLGEVGWVNHVVAKVQIGGGVHADNRGLFRRAHIVLFRVHKPHTPVVRYDGYVGRAKLAAQDRLEQERVRAVRRSLWNPGTLQAAVGRHNLGHLGSQDLRFEGGEVGVIEVMGSGVGSKAQPQLLWSAVDGKVLGAGCHLEVLGVFPLLQTLGVGAAQDGYDIRVLAEGLLAPPPARVAEEVDVRREAVQTGRLRTRAVVPGEHDVVEAPPFVRGDLCHLLDQIAVEGGG